MHTTQFDRRVAARRSSNTIVGYSPQPGSECGGGLSATTNVFRSRGLESFGGNFTVHLRAKGLLLISSLLNAAICYFSFWFMVFATSPHMDDVTMRVGFYVVNVISVSALVAIFVPWILAFREHNKFAAVFATLPVLLICLAILAFLTLDSWLNGTFSSARVSALAAASVGAAEHANS